MALLPNINVGTSPNDGTGDSLRAAFTIVNENFQFIEAFFPNSSVSNLVANITSTGTSVFNIANVATLNAATIGNTGTTITGTLLTNAQPNITTVGNITNLIVVGTLTAQGTITSQSDISSTGNVDLSGNVTTGNIIINGSRSYEVKTTSGNLYTVASDDTVILANVSGNVNVAITLPNADISSGRELLIRYYDPSFLAVNTVVAVQVETGAGNIFTTHNTAFSSFNIDPVASSSDSAQLISNGTYWLRISS